MQCFHCGREVRETRHTQKGYSVDYYLSHTGHTEWDFLISPKQEGITFRYLKLTLPTDILTCVQCYERREIWQRLDDDFHNRRSIVDSYARQSKLSKDNSEG